MANFSKDIMYYLITLNQGRLIDQTLVNVELCHVVDDDCTFELLVRVFGLQDMLQQCRFPSSKEAA